MVLITFAGRPPTTVRGGTSLLTTAPAAITAPSPMVTPQFVTAANYRVDIDDASRVTLYVGDTEYTDAVNGLNNIDMGGERYLRVKTNDGILFTEVTFVDEWYNEETSWLDRVALPALRYSIPKNVQRIT